MADPTTEEFVPLMEAAARLRIHPSTLSRRAQRAGVGLFVDPRDHRARLIRVAEVGAVAFPSPTPARSHGKEAPAEPTAA